MDIFNENHTNVVAYKTGYGLTKYFDWSKSGVVYWNDGTVENTPEIQAEIDAGRVPRIEPNQISSDLMYCTMMRKLGLDLPIPIDQININGDITVAVKTGLFLDITWKCLTLLISVSCLVHIFVNLMRHMFVVLPCRYCEISSTRSNCQNQHQLQQQPLPRQQASVC